jgi:hypothetical protein
LDAPVDGLDVHRALKKSLSVLGEEKTNGIMEQLRKKGIVFQSGAFVLQQLQLPLSEIVGAPTAKVIISMVEDELKRKPLN